MLTALRAKCRRVLAKIGRWLGSAVIYLWPRRTREAFPSPVHILVSSSSWHCGLLAAISLESVSEKNWKFVFHDDGSVTESQRLRIQKTLPGVRFISRDEAEKKMADFLSAFPKCRTHRAKHNFFLKFFDFTAFAEGSKGLLLDSDVLFFQRPQEIIEWAVGPSDSIFFNEDTQEKYSSPRDEIEGALGLKLYGNFNSGLVLMQLGAFNLPLAESFLEKFERSAHHPQFFEQTLYCLMASAWKKGGSLPRKYEINWGYLRSRGAVCRHYVGAFKHDLLYIEGATVLFLRLLPSLGKGLIRFLFSNLWRTLAVLALLLILIGGFVVAQNKFSSGRVAAFFRGMPFEAVQSRAGLPKTLKKLEDGLPVAIGFLGGSITQNAEPDGFISALHAHLKARFPNSPIRTINAGMASTDSAWGAKRIDRDLLCEKPDLVFVEFAVNDGQRDSLPDMERIVRKIHDADPATEVVFIYTTSDSAFRKLSNGKIPHAIREHEKVAAHYGIPSVVFGFDLYQKIHSGEWSWGHFSNDACHPTPAGYESYSKDLVAAIDQLLKAVGTSLPEFPAPLVSDFSLRPPKRMAAPVSSRVDLSDSAGRAARLAERMPFLGSEWIDDADFQNRSGSKWRLEFAVFDAIPDEGSREAMKAKWSPARWFEDGGGFTGLRSRLLAGTGSHGSSCLKVAPYLSSGSVEVPQVVWLPSKEGDCLIEISVQKIQGHVNSPPGRAGIDIFVRGAEGDLQKIASVVGLEGESLRLRKAIRMASGDSVVVRPFAKGYEFLEFDGFKISAGFFDNPPSL